jgi:hypothetical protein
MQVSVPCQWRCKNVRFAAHVSKTEADAAPTMPEPRPQGLLLGTALARSTCTISVGSVALEAECQGIRNAPPLRRARVARRADRAGRGRHHPSQASRLGAGAQLPPGPGRRCAHRGCHATSGDRHPHASRTVDRVAVWHCRTRLKKALSDHPGGPLTWEPPWGIEPRPLHYE